MLPSSPILFRPDELQAFAAASRDRNPLHLSEGEARRSPFGERVVYGVLGALKALARISPRNEWGLAELKVEFPSAMALGISYAVEVDDASPERVKVRLSDGRRVVLRLSARFHREGVAAPGPFRAAALRAEAVDLSLAELTEGKEVAGEYAPDEAAFRAWVASSGLESRGMQAGHVAALMACSYLVGMELPGRRALFSGLKLDFDALPAPSFPFRLKIDRRDDRFGMLSMSAHFQGARATLDAFVRPPIGPPDPRRIAPLLPRSDRLKGQTAVVTGASRGLGASIAVALESQGAQVFGTCRQKSEDVLNSARSLSGSFTMIPGDTADPSAWSELRATLQSKGGLDFLVCNASPALRPLWLEPASTDRVLDFVSRSVALVATPLSGAMDLVEKKKGVALILSSIAVKEPPGEWPHYVAAKGAIEGLAQAAAVEFPGSRVVIARPPKLITDLTNTPMGQLEGLSPDEAAARLVSALLAPRKGSGRAEIFEDFGAAAKP